MAYTTAGRLVRASCAVFGVAVLGSLALSLASGITAEQLAYMRSRPVWFLGPIAAVVACWYAVSRRPIPVVATLLLGAGVTLLAAIDLYDLYQLAANSVLPIRRGVWIRAWFSVAISVPIVVTSSYRLLRARIEHRRAGRMRTEAT